MKGQDEISGKPANQYPYVLFSYVMFINLGMLFAYVGPMLNTFVQKTGKDLGEISLVFSMRSLGGIMAALFGFRVYDYKQTSFVLFGVLSAQALVFTGIFFTSNYYILLALFLMNGFFHGMIDTGGNLTIARISSRRSSSLLSGLHSSFGMGSFLIPLLLNLFRAFTGNASLAIWPMVALLLIIAVSFCLMKPQISFEEIRKRANAVLPKMFLPVTLVYFFFYIGVEATMAGWINNFALGLKDFTVEQASYITSLYFALYTISRISMIFILVKVKNEHIIRTSITVLPIIFSLILIFFKAHIFIIGLCILSALFIGAMFPAFISNIEKKYGLSARISSKIMVGAFSGSMFFPWLVGVLFEGCGPRSMIIILLSISVITFSLGFILIKIMRKE